MNNCPICCEKFNKSNHFPVSCKGCENDTDIACRSCCQTFILGNSNDPMCMFCKNPWDRDFMNENLTQKFVNKDLKCHQENVFMEKQISLLPETQKAAKCEKKIREMLEKVNDANIVLNRLKKQIHDQNEIIRAYNLQIYRLRTGGDPDESDKNENFTIKCNTTNCNGFLDSKYYCSMCDTKFCRHCMEIKSENHVCNEDTKATIQAIKKEAKPCPGCGEMISKIDGCDQMWCIKCHIQFSWRTGAQIHGYNHNPEYFRWMRETGQEINRNPYEQRAREAICGVHVHDRTVTDIIRNIFPQNKDVLIFFQGVYMFWRHVQFRNANDTTERSINNDLKILRIKYLLNDITKIQWKKSIQQNEKKLSKSNAYLDIWLLVEEVLLHFIEKIITVKNDEGCRCIFLQMMKELTDFRNYLNSSFLKVSNTYGSTTCPGIGDNWREIYNYKQHIKKQSKVS